MLEDMSEDMSIEMSDNMSEDMSEDTLPRSTLDGKQIKEPLASTLILGQKFSVTSSGFHVYG